MHLAVYRVVVVEDESRICRNIVHKIEQNDRYHVAGTAGDGIEALAIIQELKPDVVFTDIQMPKMGGLELIRQLKMTNPDVVYVIISGYNEFEYAKTAMHLGVREYLLKPINSNALQECLVQMERTLTNRFRQTTRELLMSSLHGDMLSLQSEQHQNQPFILLLLCVGNLCSTVIPPAQYRAFQALWKSIPIEHLMNTFTTEQEHWIVIDEKVPNQKFLLLSAGERDAEGIDELVEHIQAAIVQYAGEIPVHICHLGESVLWGDIWQQAQLLRSTMDRELVATVSRIMRPTASSSALQAQLINNSMKLKLRAQVQAGNVEFMKRELFHTFHVWEQARIPQRLLEKATLHLLRSIHAQTGRLTELELFLLETDVYDQLALCTSLSAFHEGVWGIIEQMVDIPDEPQEGGRLMEQVATYLTRNYTTDISMEELAQRFHFTPSYLSKMFKKQFQETPLKYMIRLRMDEAKRLIRQHPQHELGRIAELVGYEDPHYFSRIFKNVTGVSPKEYRESVMM